MYPDLPDSYKKMLIIAIKHQEFIDCFVKIFYSQMNMISIPSQWLQYPHFLNFGTLCFDSL